MARRRSRKCRLFGSRNLSGSASDSVAERSKGPAQVPTREVASISGTPGDVSQGGLERIRHFFHRSNQGSVASPARGVQEQGKQDQAAPAHDTQGPTDNSGTGTVPAAPGNNVDATVRPTGDTGKDTADPNSGANTTPTPAPVPVGGELDVAQQGLEHMQPIPHVGQTAAELVKKANTGVDNIQNFSDTYLQPLKIFSSVVTTVAQVHPYAQITLGVLSAAAQSLINQANLDRDVSDLFSTVRTVYEFLLEDNTIQNFNNMKATLGRIAQVISEAARFIKNYAETTSFWKRYGKNIMDIKSETRSRTDSYTKVLNDLMQEYRDRAIRDIHISVHHVVEDLNLAREKLDVMHGDLGLIRGDLDFIRGDLSLEGMAYAGGAGVNKTKQCLDGTRIETLVEIVSWIQDSDENVPRILWLHGQAGRGKSAIAHTIALWLKDAGGFGSCFCFSRDRQAEHREEKIFTTIARDLADHDPAFRRALADVLARDHSLKTTSDVTLQWEKLILEPLSNVSGAMIGSMVVVVDALDESGPEESRKHILSVLGSQASDLPRNIRIFVTSRPLPDIQHVLSGASHVKATCLDDVSMESTERDIRLYVYNHLGHLPDIGDAEVQKIYQKADCLFEWARLACDYIQQNTAGTTVKERYDDVVSLQSEEGRSLLDTTYLAILKSGLPESRKALGRYRSVMHQVLMTLEPLPMAALNRMRKCFPNKQDDYDVFLILEFMSPVLGGIFDHTSPVRPLHASFYDFLTDQSRSGIYFIDISCPDDLAVATLQILHEELRFNICGLESSYSSNAEVADLAERISRSISPQLSYSCEFWSQHLEKTRFSGPLVHLLEDFVGTEKILFWIEAMSLLGRTGTAATALTSTAKWLLNLKDFKETLGFVEDGIRFMGVFNNAISHSAPHVYISALAFLPVKTALSKMLMPKFSYLLGVVGGLQHWEATQLLGLEGHTNAVWSVAFSPDGKRIVSGSRDKTVRVWDAERGVQIGNHLEGHKDAVYSVAFSPDGKRIVSGSKDKSVRVWDSERGVQIGNHLQGHTDGVYSVAFSPDGKRIASGSSDNTVKVWDAERGVQISSDLVGHTDRVYSVAFSPDSKKIVSGSWDKTVMVWDAERGVQIGTHLQGHTDPVNSVAFSPDGKRIVSGSRDKTVRVWDAERGVQIGSHLRGHRDGVNSVAFSHDGKRIVSGSRDKTVRVWDAEKGVQIGGHLEGHTDGVISVAISTDGKRIVSSSWDNTARVWDAERGGQIGSHVHGHTDPVFSVALSLDGRRIVSGSRDKTVRVWDAERGVQIGSHLEGHTDGVNAVAFSPDGKRIVSGSWDRTVRVWDAERGVQIGSDLKGHMNGVYSVAFSPDGKMIVSGSWDKTMRVWDAERGVQIGQIIEGHADPVHSVAFSSDGKRIVSGSRDKTVRVWDAERGDQIGSNLEGHTDGVCSVAITPDGKRIVSGSWDKTVRIWDAERGVQIGGHLVGHTDAVISVALSLDGRMIVSGSRDKTVRVWDVDRGVQIGSHLEGHADGVNSVTISPDGKRIVSGSQDNTMRIWNANPYEQTINTCKQLKLTASNPCNAPIPLNKMDIISPCHICFSSISSHALCDGEQLLEGLSWGSGESQIQPVKLHSDGWIRGPKGRLLLWIPVSVRYPLYSMQTIAVIPKGCCIELDLSQMVHGNKWHECYKIG